MGMYIRCYKQHLISIAERCWLADLIIWTLSRGNRFNLADHLDITYCLYYIDIGKCGGYKGQQISAELIVCTHTGVTHSDPTLYMSMVESNHLLCIQPKIQYVITVWYTT